MDATPTTINAHQRLRRRLRWLAVGTLALLGLTLAWSWSPLRDYLNLDQVVATVQGLGQRFGPLAAVAGFAVAVSLAVPLTFLTLVCIVAFGPWQGMAVALGGALIGAAVSHTVGAALGREALQRLGSERVNLLSQRLGQRGVLAVVAVRMVPIAPFAIVNMIAGASHIRLRDLLLGTAIGMAPSTIGMAIFTEPLIAALKQPSAPGLVMLGLGLLAFAVLLWGWRRWMRR